MQKIAYIPTLTSFKLTQLNVKPAHTPAHTHVFITIPILIKLFIVEIERTHFE